MTRLVTLSLMLAAACAAGCSTTATTEMAPATSGGWTTNSITGAPRAPGTGTVVTDGPSVVEPEPGFDPYEMPPAQAPSEPGWSGPAIDDGAGASCGAGGKACG